MSVLREILGVKDIRVQASEKEDKINVMNP
jgi:hypothetical protein